MSNITEADLKKLTPSQMAELINKMAAERDAAVAKAESKATITVKFRDPDKLFKNSKTEKDEPGSGAFSVYGLMRFPITLYAGGWERLLSDPVRDMILAEIKAHPTAPRK